MSIAQLLVPVCMVLSCLAGHIMLQDGGCQFQIRVGDGAVRICVFYQALLDLRWWYGYLPHQWMLRIIN